MPPSLKRFLHACLVHPLVARLTAPAQISSYLRSTDVKKLHLGGAGLSGWLNTDLFPAHWRSVRMDATSPYPLPSASFDYVFSEHMIEHLPLDGARRMLAECHRVLRPGGRIRLATPDLARVVSLYAASDSAHRDYLRWAVAHNRLPSDLPPDVLVVNSLFHDHGHRFIFDEAALTALLLANGFVDVSRHVPGSSDCPALHGLEVHHFAIGHAANNFETLILEARKP